MDYRYVLAPDYHLPILQYSLYTAAYRRVPNPHAHRIESCLWYSLRLVVPHLQRLYTLRRTKEQAGGS